MDNVIKALMRCRNTDNEYHPELCNPHYFKMPNGQLVLYATDTHILLIVKDTAGMLDKYDFEPSLTPNIAAVIPTAPCNSQLSATQLNIALRKVGRACWSDETTAIDIEGVYLPAKAADRLLSVLYDLGLESVPMAVNTTPPTTLKLETEQYIIVQAGMINDPDFVKHVILY